MIKKILSFYTSSSKKPKVLLKKEYGPQVSIRLARIKRKENKQP